MILRLRRISKVLLSAIVVVSTLSATYALYVSVDIRYKRKTVMIGRDVLDRKMHIQNAAYELIPTVRTFSASYFTKTYFL